MSVIVLGGDTLSFDVGCAARGEYVISGGAGSIEMNCLVSSRGKRRHKIFNYGMTAKKKKGRAHLSNDCPSSRDFWASSD